MVTRRTGGWFVWSRRLDPGEPVAEYVGAHRGEGEGRDDQPRSGRHTPEYVAMHEATGRMYPMGQAGRVRPEWQYERGF